MGNSNKKNIQDQFIEWYINKIDKLTTYPNISEINTYHHLIQFVEQLLWNAHNKISDIIGVSNVEERYFITFNENSINKDYSYKIVYKYLRHIKLKLIQGDISVYNNAASYKLNQNLVNNKEILGLICDKIDINSKMDELNKLIILRDQLIDIPNDNLLKTEIIIKKNNITNELKDANYSIDEQILLVEELVSVQNQINQIEMKNINMSDIKTKINCLTNNIVNYKLFIKISQNSKITLYNIKNEMLKTKSEINDNLLVMFKNVINDNNVNINLQKLNFHFNKKITSYEVHSFVLNYEYFHNLNNFEYLNNNKSKVEINLEINHKHTGEDLIRYLYTREFDIKFYTIPANLDVIGRLQSLIILADYLRINNLYALCSNMLQMLTNSLIKNTVPE